MFRSSRISAGAGDAAGDENLPAPEQVVQELLAIADRVQVVRQLAFGQGSAHHVEIVRVRSSASKITVFLPLFAAVSMLELAAMIARAFLLQRQADVEGRTLPGRAARRDQPAVALDDLAANRQADPGTLVVTATVQPLKNRKHAIEVLLVEADAIVADRDAAESCPSVRPQSPPPRRVFRR